MQTKTVAYVRQNAIALLALFVALGGTSYAALTINGSQIRNKSIGAVKFDPKSVAASIKAWVDLSWRNGKLVAVRSSSAVRVSTGNGGGESIHWLHQRFSAGCLVAATAHDNGGANIPNTLNTGYVNSQFTPPSDVFIAGFGPDGTRRVQAGSLMLVCP